MLVKMELAQFIGTATLVLIRMLAVFLSVLPMWNFVLGTLVGVRMVVALWLFRSRIIRICSLFREVWFARPVDSLLWSSVFSFMALKAELTLLMPTFRLLDLAKLLTWSSHMEVPIRGRSVEAPPLPRHRLHAFLQKVLQSSLSASLRTAHTLVLGTFVAWLREVLPYL